MADIVLDRVKRASGWSIVLAILMILAGVIAIGAPLIAGVVIVYIVAWTAIFNGGAQLVYAFRAQSGGRMVLELLLGLLYIVAGVFILLHPAGGLLALTLIIASILLVYGVFALVLAFQMRPLPGWGWVLFDAIVTILLGALIWAHWPINSEWVVGTLVGISFVVSGVSRLMLSLTVRRLASRAA
ncbi:MAG TPA: HdeD family acid-resistance protein [Candidatus Eisenbacteria bacterium]|nr:HdeD family acid-resistance protein [Candidatus Eisenbacteria bacterium]